MRPGACRLLLCARGGESGAAPGAGGLPLPCKNDTVCLMGLKILYRYKLECEHLTVEVNENGSFLKPDVLFNCESHCITWLAGTLKSCAVTETRDDGKKRPINFTYNCTRASDTLTSPAPIFSSLTLITPSTMTGGEDDHKNRHHLCAVATVVPVLLLIFGICYLMIRFQMSRRQSHSIIFNNPSTRRSNKMADDARFPVSDTGEVAVVH